MACLLLANMEAQGLLNRYALQLQGLSWRATVEQALVGGETREGAGIVYPGCVPRLKLLQRRLDFSGLSVQDPWGYVWVCVCGLLFCCLMHIVCRFIDCLHADPDASGVTPLFRELNTLAKLVLSPPHNQSPLLPVGALDYSALPCLSAWLARTSMVIPIMTMAIEALFSEEGDLMDPNGVYERELNFFLHSRLMFCVTVTSEESRMARLIGPIDPAFQPGDREVLVESVRLRETAKDEERRLAEHEDLMSTTVDRILKRSRAEYFEKSRAAFAERMAAPTQRTVTTESTPGALRCQVPGCGRWLHDYGAMGTHLMSVHRFGTFDVQCWLQQSCAAQRVHTAQAGGGDHLRELLRKESTEPVAEPFRRTSAVHDAARRASVRRASVRSASMSAPSSPTREAVRHSSLRRESLRRASDVFVSDSPLSSAVPVEAPRSTFGMVLRSR
jgi:hypothetical protein